MHTTNNERNGLVKTTWEKVRNHVKKVEPKFAAIVDKLSPNKLFPLYLAYYPYGAIEADTESSLLPKAGGGYCRLSDPNIPKEIAAHLGYGKNSSPLGMVLEKQLELYIDLKHEGITIPWLIYTPGKIFPFARILSHQSSHTYAPNGLLSSTAGARSAFLLPNIGCATNHANLQRDFNIHSPAPKTLYEHWHTFREIINSPALNTDWRCCVLYFSANWIEHIHNDSAWSELKQYLHELAWNQYEHERNRIFYDISFAMIKRKRNLKPNPYLADTARHLFTMAIGAAPGYAPAYNDDAMPTSLLQKIYIESYGLKKYLPTIMHPVHLDNNSTHSPIYYSLQNPSTHVFSPKSREISSTLAEMRELEHIMRVFKHELSKEKNICSDTIMGEAAKRADFRYYHNKPDRHRIITPSKSLIEHDDRFSVIDNKHLVNGHGFSADAPFVRGCISINL